MTPSRAHDENVVNIAITIAATIVTTTVITATATIVVAFIATHIVPRRVVASSRRRPPNADAKRNDVTT